MLPNTRSGEGVLALTGAAVGATSAFQGGIAVVGNTTHYTYTPASSFVNGYMVSPTGQLCVSAGPITSYSGGYPRDAVGALVVSGSAPLADDPFVGGVRVGAGGVYVTGTFLQPSSATATSATTVHVVFPSCVVIVDHTKVELQRNGGAWTPANAHTGTSPEFDFTFPVTMVYTDTLVLRGLAGYGTDCETVPGQLQPFTINVINNVPPVGNFILLETGGNDIILLEGSAVDGILLEGSP